MNHTITGEMSPERMSPEVLAAVGQSSFYAGMRVLPLAEREAMFAIYGFCRLVDDIADDQTRPRPERAQALDQWRADIAALYAGDECGQAGFLRDAVARFGLDQADFIAVIDGMQMDVDADLCWPAYATFDLYCDRVASAVGRLSVRVFGMDLWPGRKLSEHLGKALQFTNVLRDIDEDAAIGRVYLPQEALAAAGIKPTTIEALITHPQLDQAARWLARRAEAHFAAAASLMADRPKGHLIAPRLMLSAYRPLLAKMVRQGWKAPRRRVRTNKVLMAAKLAGLWLTQWV